MGFAESVDPKFRLSKSKIAAFEHCAKRLWLGVHRPDVAKIEPATLALFRSGHLLGEFARDQVPGGVLVHARPDIGAALSQTRELLDGGWDQPIFEATFQHQDVIVRADILEPDGRGGWRLAEVKNATRVHSYQLYDVATQVWTALGQGVRLSSFAVRHVTTKVRSTADLKSGILVDTDVTWHVLGIAQRRLSVIEAARACVRGPQPTRPPGPYCTRPFVCEFREFCRSGSKRASGRA